MESLAKLKFVLICSIFLIYGVSLSLLAPFYPGQAKNRGLTDFQSGVVVGIAFLTTMFATPVAAKRIHKLGAEEYLVIGKLSLNSLLMIVIFHRFVYKCPG